MGRKDRTTFRLVVPRAVRRAARVLTVSERTKRDLVEFYGPPGADRGHAERRRPCVLARGGARTTTSSPSVRFSGARTSSRRSSPPLPAGLPLVVVGPEKDAALAAALREVERGSRATSRPSGSSSCTAAPPVSCSRALRGIRAPRRWRRWLRERRSWPSREPRSQEVAGDAAVFVTRPSSPRASARRSPSASGWSRPGSSEPRRSAGARPPSGRSPSTRRYSGRESFGRRRLARTRRRARALAPAARSQVDEVVVVANVPGSAAGMPDGVRVLENPRPLRSRRTSTSGSPRRRASTC